jgi:hypothetical protein
MKKQIKGFLIAERQFDIVNIINELSFSIKIFGNAGWPINISLRIKPLEKRLFIRK